MAFNLLEKDKDSTFSYGVALDCKLERREGCLLWCSAPLFLSCVCVREDVSSEFFFFFSIDGWGAAAASSTSFAILFLVGIRARDFHRISMNLINVDRYRNRNSRINQPKI